MSGGAPLTIAFVSAPGSSVFMAELLAGVADAVTALADPDVTVVSHHGLVSDVVDGATVAVVVPHEYLAVAPPEPDDVLAHTVAFGVEHPGTSTFRASTRVGHGSGRGSRSPSAPWTACPHGASTARCSPWATCRAGTSGVAARLSATSTSPTSGRPNRAGYGILAHAAPALAALRTELLAPPHEPMTGPRPDFLVGADKWRLLARSKVLVNLHREDKSALEWVRVLEAMHNGCVVVTEPSSDLGPLVPGEHLLVAHPENVGLVAAAVARDDALRERIATAGPRCAAASTWPRPPPRSWRRGRELATRPAPPRPSRWSPWWPGGPRAWPRWRSGCRRSTGVARRHRWPRPRWTAAAPHAIGDGVAAVVAALPADGPVPATVLSLAQHLPSCSALVATPEPGAHRGAARNALLATSDAAYVAVLDGGDELLSGTLAEMVAMLRAERRARRGPLPGHPRQPIAGQRAASRGAQAARARLPDARLRRPAPHPRGARRVHRGPRPRRARRSPLLALPGRRRRSHRRAAPDRARALAALIYRQVSRQVSRLVSRRGQPVDIDEAGYLSIALTDSNGLVDGGPGGYWDAVMEPSVQAPLMTALTAPAFAVAGTGIMTGLATARLRSVRMGTRATRSAS